MIFALLWFIMFFFMTMLMLLVIDRNQFYNKFEQIVAHFTIIVMASGVVMSLWLIAFLLIG